MRIKEEIKRLGYFWLPSKPREAVPGILSISDGGNIELEVVHRLGGRSTSFGDDVKRIVGQIEEEKFVTLDHCDYKNGGGSGGILTQSFNVKRAFTGVTYKEDESPCFNALTFSVEGAEKWVAQTVEVNHQFEQYAVTISYGPLVETPLDLDNGMQLSIEPYVKFDGQFQMTEEFEESQRTNEFGISSGTNFKLVSQVARELDEFISVAQKITAFLCFATNEIVCVDSMSATADNLHRDIEVGTTRMDPENIYYSSWPYSKNESQVDSRSMLFGFKEMLNDAKKIINRWIEIYEQIEPALDLYFLAKMGAQPSPKAKFLALAQSLEASHRRTFDENKVDEVEFEELVKNLINQCPPEHRNWLENKLSDDNEMNLRKRLGSIIKPFKEVIGSRTKRDSLIHKIVVLRNYLTHYDPSWESEIPKDEDLPLLCLKMELLFQLYILQLIDFSPEQIDSIVANCPQFIVWKLQ